MSELIGSVVFAAMAAMFLAALLGKMAVRNHLKDRDATTGINEKNEITDHDLRWRVQFIREDVASIFGVLVFIAGLLGAILLALVVK
jgi:hypothetical protein